MQIMLISLIILFFFVFVISFFFSNYWFVLLIYRNLFFEQFSLINLLMDKTSVLFCMTLCFVVLSVIIFSSVYMKEEGKQGYFYLMLLAFTLSMFTLIMSYSPIIFFIGWDGLGLSSFWLIAWYSSSAHSNYSALHTYLIMRLGDASLLLYFASFCFNGETILFPSSPFPIISFFFLMVAAFTKSAQFPFISWLPLAMAAPTPISALVHSSTLVTAGIYILLRAMEGVFFLPDAIFGILIFIGCLTAMLGSVSAGTEFDLKKCIAFSTLSHCGLMVLGLGLQQYVFVFFHLIAHALLKSMLFILAGWILFSQSGEQDMRNMNMTVISLKGKVCLMMNAINMISFPFLGLWYSKHTLTSGPFALCWVYLMVLVMAYASYFYVSRLIYFTLFSKSNTVITTKQKWETSGFLFLHLVLIILLLSSLPLNSINSMDILGRSLLFILILSPFIMIPYNNMKVTTLQTSLYHLLTPFAMNKSMKMEMNVNSIPQLIYPYFSSRPLLMGSSSTLIK